MYHPSMAAAAGLGAGAAGTLAITGAYSLVLVALGIALVLAGLVLAAASRRGGRRARRAAKGGSPA